MINNFEQLGEVLGTYGKIIALLALGIWVGWKIKGKIINKIKKYGKKENSNRIS